MGEMNLLPHFQAAARAVGNRRRRPFSDAVDRQDGRVVEGRGIECTGGMALVVLGEEDAILPVEAGTDLEQLLAEQILLEKLFAQPNRHGHPERREPLGGECKVGFEKALELEERLVVESDEIDTVQIGVSLVQAIGDRLVGKARIMLLAREPLFLRRGKDGAVLDQGDRAVVIEGRDSEDPHAGGRLENGVDERSHG